MRRRSFTSLLLSFSLLSLSVPTFAQSQQNSNKAEVEKKIASTGPSVYTISGTGNGVAVAGGGDGGSFTFVSSFGVNETTIKGQPMSAEAISESIQILADGNRIIRKSTVLIYRDSEGRSRREQTFTNVGQYTSSGEPPRIINIHDPVAGVSYTLDVRNKTARKFVFSQKGQKDFNAGYAAGTAYSVSTGQGGSYAIAVTDPAQKAEIEAKLAKAREKEKKQATTVSGNAVVITDGVVQTSSYSGTVSKRDRKEEALGKQTMEGVEVEGTRYMTTIPAGEIGNELPINIVTEKWYSQELRQVIYLKTSDPRFGETIYRLTNINRSEPNRSLFEVPADYTIKELPVKAVIQEKIEREIKEKEKTKKPQQ